MTAAESASQAEETRQRIAAIPSEQLFACITYEAESGEFDYSNEHFQALRITMGPGVWAGWLKSEIGQSLYERGDWDDDQLTRFEER